VSGQGQHICVCICTYKRSELLKRLLDGLRQQETEGRFTYSLVVADNDGMGSARNVVLEFAAGSDIPTVYCVEPRQNIALARNKALEHVRGDYVAFFDDDQLPGKGWLLTLLRACEKYDADGVLGPVKPYFEAQPPAWVVKGKFYERPIYASGMVIDWRKGRTGNVLLRRHIFSGEKQVFRPEFLTGEDQDFFRRMIERGHVFVWCNEAVAYETVPPVRWKRSFMLKRALLRGKVSLAHSSSRRLEILKSVVAVPAYTLALPFLLVGGQHQFMKYLIKTFDHAGRLLALVGMNPVSEHYVTE
jgi:succinoglycan biosynthesis protein ExoM